ncbi:MAG: branched-chain amino acid transport system permease protein livM [Actinomycetota bacterium]|jgi:ABC-type branched-subunit amino acid transport system permease subunit|nr:branched-chain amino acid transport system permease protein livM [Actinomycetota bacterium]
MTDLFSYIVIGLSRGLVYGILALGLVLVYKGTKILNLAQPFFGLLGAFLAWWLTARAGFLPFEAMSRPRMIVAALLTIALVGLHGLMLERTLFHRLRNAPRLVTLVATLAIGQGTVGLVTILFSRNQRQAETLRIIPTGIRSLIQLGDVNLTGGDLQVLLVVPVVALALAAYFKLSRFGVAIRAAADNGDAARLLGVSVDRVAMFVWAAGAALAALAGILLAAKEGSLAPSTLSTGFLVKALAAALIGGLTSLPGALVGGLVVGVGEAIINGYLSNTIGAADVVFFVAVVVMLAFRPQGLFGQRDDAEDTAAFVPAVRDLPRRLQETAYPLLFGFFGKLTFVVFALAICNVTGAATNDVLTQVMIYAMVGVSLTILMGYTGQISLGHWALAGVGAFASANLFGRFHVPFLLTLPLVFVVGALVSLAIGLPALRIKGLYLAVVTVTFSYAAELFLFKSGFFGGGTTGRAMPPVKLGPLDLDSPTNRPLFVFTLGLLLLSMLLARNVLRSRVGRSFVALRENEKAAATLGVRLAPTRLLAFALSGGIAAVAGLLFALRTGTVNAIDFPTEISLVLVLMAIIGGLPTLAGPLLGSFIVFGLPFLLKFDNGWIIPIGTGALTIVVITRLQGGLGGLVLRGRETAIDALVEIEEGTAPVPSTA